MQAPDLLFLVSSQEAKWLSKKVITSEFFAALSIGEFVTGPLAQHSGNNGILSSFEVLDYSSSQFPVSSSWIWKELGKHWQGIWNIWYCLARDLHQTSNELEVQMRTEYLIFRFHKLSWSWMGSHWGVDFVSFVERENTYDFFSILAFREWNSILHKIHTDTQYLFALSELFGLEFSLQQISKSFIDLLCCWHNQDVINIDE